jgi:hypothetical protein
MLGGEFVSILRRPLLVSSLRYLPDLVENSEDERETNRRNNAELSIGRHVTLPQQR